MLLTVIIPVFNTGVFLRYLLDELLFQVTEIKDLVEIIVVNDGSTDDSLEILREFELKISNFKIINQKNKGVSVARNNGIKKASGEYIYFLDSDDCITHNTIEYFIKTLRNFENKDLYCFGYFSKKNNKLLKKYKINKFSNKTILQNDFLKEFLSKYIPCHICSVVIRKSIIFDNNIFFNPNLKIGEDTEFLLKYFISISTIYCSNRYCFIYQIRDDSAMRGYKTYSLKQYNAFKISASLLNKGIYQNNELFKYSNFWINNNLILNLYYYMKSNVIDEKITNGFIKDLSILKKPIAKGKLIHLLAIQFAKLLPLKKIIKKVKSK